MRRIFTPFFLLLAFWMCGCTLLSESNGMTPFWNKYEPGTRQGRAYSHHLAGIISERQGELHQALEEYNAVLKKDAKAVTPWLRLIRTQLRLEDGTAALESCEKALRSIPDSPELWIALAELHHNAGNIEEAVEAIKQAITLRPDDLTGYGALVELQEKTNDLVAAIEIYEKLIEKSPDSAALYYQLGINFTRIEDNESAKKALLRVLELEPRVTRARFLLALVYFQLNDFPNCEMQLRAYLQERPDDTTALEYLAGTLYRTDRREEARDVFEHIIAQGNVSPKNHLQLAWTLFQLGELERAQQFALEGGAYIFADVLFALAQSEKPGDEAWTTNPWDDRYTFDEVDTESDLILGILPTLFGQEEVVTALAGRLETLEKKTGFSPVLEFFRARILLQGEKYEEARDCFQSLFTEGVTSKYFHYYSAVIEEEKGNIDEAEKHLRAFLRDDPDDPDVMNYLGFMFSENNRNLEEAESLLKRALALDPENPYYMDSLGWVYYRQGKGKEALQMIRGAIYGMESDDAVLRDHLGDVYLLLGNTERALAEWRRSIRLDPTMEPVRKKIEAHTAIAP